MNFRLKVLKCFHWKQVLTILLLIAVPISAFPHTYFVALSEVSVNQKQHRIEIVHHFTTHDLETRLSDKYQLRLSADSDNFALYLQRYIEQGFSISKDRKSLKSQWIGFENDVSETTIYQTIDSQTTLLGLKISNRLLTDYFPKQINRVIFSDGKLSGSLIFDKQHHTLPIK